MRHLAGDDLELHTVSYDAEDHELSERSWFDTTAAAANARQHRVAPRSEELVEDLERLMAAQYEPFISTSIYAQFCVFRAASEAYLRGLDPWLDDLETQMLALSEDRSKRAQKKLTRLAAQYVLALESDNLTRVLDMGFLTLPRDFVIAMEKAGFV